MDVAPLGLRVFWESRPGASAPGYWRSARRAWQPVLHHHDAACPNRPPQLPPSPTPPVTAATAATNLAASPPPLPRMRSPLRSHETRVCRYFRGAAVVPCFCMSLQKHACGDRRQKNAGIGSVGMLLPRIPRPRESMAPQKMGTPPTPASLRALVPRMIANAPTQIEDYLLDARSLYVRIHATGSLASQYPSQRMLIPALRDARICVHPRLSAANTSLPFLGGPSCRHLVVVQTPSWQLLTVALRNLRKPAV
jgi:hypothetical protein